MCELMGVCFQDDVRSDVTIRAFALRDVENADGWGLAWYHNGSLTLVKEPLSWTKSKYAHFLVSYDQLRSRIFIGHVRHATVGGPPKHSDTHPFSREVMGRQYCFAHNGTVRPIFDRLVLDRYHPIGETDSEYAFCYLLDCIAKRDAHLDDEKSWRWLHKKFSMLNEMGKFNCILSDGVRLFCYHDVNGFKGLHVHGIGLEGDELEALDDAGLSLEIESVREVRGAIVATRALNDSHWHPFHHGELLVIENGRLMFSSCRTHASRQQRRHATA